MAPSPLNVLVVDDEPTLREVLSLRIAGWGHEVRAAADVGEAEAAVAAARPDLVVSDVVLPEASGLELLKRLRRREPDLPVVMITAHGHVDAAVEAMKVGALDFLTKPLDHAALKVLLETVAEDVRQRRDTAALLATLDRRDASHGLVGRSRPMRELFRQLESLGPSDASALLIGESGTGKEVVARTLHALSPRRDGPFVAINAAAIPEGLIESEIFGHEVGAFTGATRARPGCFELAHGGTLLLDEIGDMPPALQPRLLRILEDGRARRLGGTTEHRLDVRVLAATNHVPADAIRSGRLREDLYYRLSVFELTLPTLRDRPGDVHLLAHYFTREFARKHRMPVEGVREAACERLAAHAWPGNVRELRNVVERAVIVARRGWVESHHLPAALQELAANGSATITLPAGVTLADAERAVILHTLERTGRNKAEAARRLGLDVKTVRAKLKSYRPPA